MKLTPPITIQSFHTLCSKWADILLSDGESGIHMWPPIIGPYMRVYQLLADKNLQKKLFKNTDIQLIFIEADEKEDITFEEFSDKVKQYLRIEDGNFSLRDWSANQKSRIGIFLFGFDTALRNGKVSFIDELSNILAKYHHVSVIFITEVNIEESLYNKLMVKSPFLQNVLYQSLYSFDDSIQFFKYLEQKWSFNLSEGLATNIINKVGGHFLLLKEAGRLMRANKTISLEEILKTPSMIQKGKAIFEFLNNTDKKTIIEMLQGKTVNKVSDYLKQTGLVDNGKIGIKYWVHIKNDLLPIEHSSYNLDAYLTSQERSVLECLLDIKGVVSRDKLSEVIWAEQSEKKYSDWAIDQLIHRLRQKIKKAKFPYEIKTKKSEGFILLSK